MKTFLLILLLTSLSLYSQTDYYGKEFKFSLIKYPLSPDVNKYNLQINISGKSQISQVVITLKNQILYSNRVDNNYISINLEIEESDFLDLDDMKTNKLFKIVTENETKISLLNSNFDYSEGTLLTPVLKWGNEYRLNNLSNQLRANQSESKPSNIAGAIIISNGNSNNIIIYKKNINKGSQNPNQLELVLDKDEVYYLNNPDINQFDLSGTYIVSESPISVTSTGNSAIIDILNTTEDLLIENETPVKTFGNNFIVGKYHIDNNIYYPYIKIVAHYDETIIKINKNEIATIGEGEVFEYYANSNILVESSKPINLAQYMKSSPAFLLGDPFLINTTSINQYDNDYDIVKPNSENIDLHFVGISCHDSTLGTIRLNGSLLDINKFENVNNSNFHYGVFELTEEFNNFNSENNFGVIVFGVGQLDSYGYTAGGKLDKIDNLILDTTKPSIIINPCDYSVFLSETGEYRSGIRDIIPEFQNSISSLDITKNREEYILQVSPENKSDDIELQLTVIDSSGNKIDTLIRFPGFSINAEIEPIGENLSAFKLHERQLTITNNSNYSKSLKLEFDIHKKISINANNRVVNLEPNEIKQIPVYFASEEYEIFSDVLTIRDSCKREVSIDFTVDFSFKRDVDSRCEYKLMISNKEDLNQDLEVEVFNLNGQLLDKFNNTTELNLSKYAERIIIIKEIHGNHYHIRKFFIQ